MEIISLVRQSNDVAPETFIVGQSPMKNIQDMGGPKISKIKYWAISTVYDKVFRGPVYVIEFKDSTIKRVIPADSGIIDIAVETAIKQKEAELPNLPE